MTGNLNFRFRIKIFFFSFDFSTKNPFLEMFDRGGLYQKLKTLFAFEVPDSLCLNSRIDDENVSQDDLLEEIADQRRRQLEHLERIFECLATELSIDSIIDGKFFLKSIIF